MTPLDIGRVRGEFPGRRIDYHATIDSTMRAAADLPLGAVVIAGGQTAGQGRHGHSWHSEPGSGLYCSIVLEPSPFLTLALGLATADAITAVTGAACDLRWPNDVMLGDRKTAGILVQLVSDIQLGEGPKAVAGIGINLNHQEFPPEIAELATSIRLHTGKPASATDMLIALLHSVDSFAREEAGDILRLFSHASSYIVGRRVTVDLPDGVITGTTVGLDASGYLKVRKDDGSVTLVLAGGVRAAGA